MLTVMLSSRVAAQSFVAIVIYFTAIKLLQLRHAFIKTRQVLILYISFKFSQTINFCRSCLERHLIFVHPFDTLGHVLFTIFPPRGWLGNYEARFSCMLLTYLLLFLLLIHRSSSIVYAKEGSTILSSVLFWTMTPVYWVADMHALKKITSDRHTFIKDLSNVCLILLVTTDATNVALNFSMIVPRPLAQTSSVLRTQSGGGTTL